MKLTKDATYNATLKLLQDANIVISDELAQTMFKSHMDSLMVRLVDAVPLDNPEEDYALVLNDISPENLSLAQTVSDFVFSQFDRPSTMMETVLIATHIQTQQEKEKEEQ